MKSKIPRKMPGAILALSFVFASVLPAAAQSVQQVYEDAVRAYHQGDLVSAKAGLTRVIRADPRHSTARAYLARVDFQLKKVASSGSSSMQRNLEKVIVPSVEFNDATLGSVIEFIPQKTAELTNNQFQPSIVFQGDKALLEQKKITLKLTNVPMSEVLRYVGELSQMRYKYDKYAIVMTPLGAKPVAEATPGASSDSLNFPPKGTDPFGGKPAADPFK